MTLADVLNLDISAVGEGLGRGFRWWTGELADLAPASWRQGRIGNQPVLELTDGQTARLWRGGRAIEAAETSQIGAADIAAPETLALQREITLPALRLDDLRRLVANDLDRLTPFAGDEVYFDLEAAAPEPGAERVTARLAVIRRADAEATIERARRFGVRPKRLGIADEPGRLRFDFMPSIRAAAGRVGQTDRAPLLWWSAVAIGIALNIGALVLKDALDVAQLKRIVDLQQPSVSLAFKLRQRVDQETRARQILLTRHARNDPLRLLDAVTRALPAPQSLSRLEWNGHSVRLVGYRDPHFDVLAALETSKMVTRPRSASTAETPAPGAKVVPFDVVADANGGGK
jgi:general secretion pathway protein L